MLLLIFCCKLEHGHVGSAEALALRIVLHVELHALSLVELTITAGLNRAEMDENVLAGFLRDEAEALGRVEPLDRSVRRHACHNLLKTRSPTSQPAARNPRIIS